MVEVAENVYNRLILFKGSKLYHSSVVDAGFGFTKETARLTQIFFFNTENKTIYHPPNPTEIFINYKLLKNTNSNYTDNSSLNVFYNWHKMNEIFGDILEKKYEYIILTRSNAVCNSILSDAARRMSCQSKSSFFLSNCIWVL
jgi:hypothetical protein